MKKNLKLVLPIAFALTAIFSASIALLVSDKTSKTLSSPFGNGLNKQINSASSIKDDKVSIPNTPLFMGISNIALGIYNYTNDKLGYGYTDHNISTEGFRYYHTKAVGWHGWDYVNDIFDYRWKLESVSHHIGNSLYRYDVMYPLKDSQNNLHLWDFYTNRKTQPSWYWKVWNCIEIPLSSFDGFNWHAKLVLL